MSYKHYLIFKILFLFTWCISAQVEFKGKIVDTYSGFPVTDAIILDLESGERTVSNSKGEFQINKTGALEISAGGYISFTYERDNSNYAIISLIPADNILDQVIINANSIPERKREATQSISIISKTDLKYELSHDLSLTLNKVPGVYMQSGTLNTNRISIRGIGARNLFGTANIRAYYGDIPLTDGNGESSIEDLELNSISSIEILKGPAASTYGVGLGGTILFKPSFSNFENIDFSSKAQIGSFGFFKSTLEGKAGTKNSAINFVYSNTHSDGYRDNNLYDRQTYTLTSRTILDPSNTLTFLGSVINLKGGIPSSLSLLDYNNSPKKAAFTWGRSSAFEDVDYAIAGLSWRHEFNPRLAQLTTLSYSYKNNYEPRPFNILKEGSDVMSIRTRMLGSGNLLEQELDFSIGVESFFDNYNNKTFENLYQDFPEEQGSVRGNQLTEFKERRFFSNFFAEGNISFSDKLKVNLGANLNITKFKVEDTFTNTELENNGNFSFQPIFSPKIGFNYKFNDELFAFGSISHGFSTPTTSETLLPEGQFNPDLRPEIGWNFEAGTRFYLWDNRLTGSLTLYKMLVSDLLVARRTQEDDFFAINAGESIHNGLELDINYRILQKETFSLNLRSALSLHDYKFSEFVDAGMDYSGNRVTGVPKYNANLQVRLESNHGLYGNISWQGIGEMAANDANNVFAESYDLLNAIVGYNINLGNNFNVQLYFTANNILDEKYSSQLQINAIGFGENAPRFYYPGLPRNFFGGINFSFLLK